LCRFQDQQRVLSSTFLPPQLRILIRFDIQLYT
jgi:hypothetical protein